MFLKNVILLGMIISLNTSPISSHLYQPTLMAPYITKLISTRQAALSRIQSLAIIDKPAHKEEMTVRIKEHGATISFYVFNQKANLPEGINEIIKDFLVYSVNFFCQGEQAFFDPERALEAYYFSSKTFSEYQEAFFASESGQDLLTKATQNCVALKDKTDVVYYELARRAFIGGFKANFSRYIRFLEEFFPERYQKTFPNHTQATCQDVWNMIQNPETPTQKTLLEIYSMQDNEKAANDFLSEEFPESHILFWRS